MSFLLLVAMLCVSDDADAILKRMIEAEKANGKLAAQYTYVEEERHYEFAKDGAKKLSRTNTFDVIFVEGEQYRKLVARDGKPLAGKEAAKEEARLAQTKEERRKARRNGLLHKTVTLGTAEDLLALFENAVVGEEEVRGRKAWVISSKPKADHTPADAREREVMSFERRAWVDEGELAIVRSVSTVVGRNGVFLPGATIGWEFEKLKDGVWIETSGVLDGRMEIAKVMKPHVRTEYDMRGFQKFDVQSTITTEPVK